MLARVFVFFGGLLVVGLCSLLLAPFFVEWADYRSSFEREASRIIGQPVRVEGTVTARILPFPSVTFSNVVIDGPDGIPAARIAAFSMDAELAPFFSGEILIFDMRIDRPELRLKLTEKGAWLWRWPQSEALQGGKVALENVTILDGRLTLERAGLKPVLLSSINGKVSADALNGPWQAEGRLTNGATTYNARLSTAVWLAGETLRMRLSLAPQDGFYDAAFDGRISLVDEAPVYSGKLEMSVLGIAQDVSEKRQKLADVKGDFSANAVGITVADAIFAAGPSNGPYTAEGSMGLTLGENARFDVMLKGQPVNFGDIEGNAKADRVTLGVPLSDRLAAIRALLVQIPLPDIPGRIDLKLPALVIGDTIIRNAEVKAVPSKSGWQVERFAVELPGRTLVEGSGDLAFAGEMAFEGPIVFASKQPTGFLNWLGLSANDALRALPNAGLSARINLNAARQTLRDVEFRAGGAVLRGLIDRQVPKGALPQISVQLAGENLDFDVVSSFADLAKTGNPWLGAQDVDVSLRSEPVLGFGFEADGLSLEAQYESGTVIVKEAKLIGFSGADVSLSGSLSNSIVEPKGAVDVDILAIDPIPLIDALAARFPDQNWLNSLGSRAANAATALADAKLTATLLLGVDADGLAALTADYKFDGAGLRFTGAIEQLAAGGVSLTANGDADNGVTLLAAMGLLVGDAVFALNFLEPVDFEVSTISKAGQIQSGLLKAVSQADRFETELGQGEQAFSLVLDDAAAYAMAVGYGLPGAAFGLPLSLKGKWENKGPTFHFGELNGTFVDVPVTGQMVVTPGERLKIIGQINAASFDRSVVDEIVFGSLAAGGDDRAVFTENMGLPFDGEIVLQVNEAIGFTPMLLQQASARFLASKDALRFVDIKGNMAGGQLAGSAEVRKNRAEGFIVFNGSLKGADLSQTFGTNITGNGDLQIELSAAGSTMETLKSSLAGSGIFGSNNVLLRGISNAGFNALLAETDRLIIAPDAIAALDLAEGKIMLGQTALPPFETAFTVASGLARAPTSLLQIDGGAFAIEPKIDLNSGEAEINAQLVFNIRTDDKTGTEPSLMLNLSGPWNELGLVIDPQPLQSFLGERALEREETRVEAIQSALLEKQRLRRENRYYALLIEARAKAEDERLAEIERLVQESEKAEQDRLEKIRIENEKLAAESQKTTDQAIVPQNNAPVENLPLNLDGLIKQLETAPLVQP